MGSRTHDHDPEELQAYVKLMTEHQWAIRGFILSLMPGSPDVGDVLQETNLVLWQKRERFEHGTNFLAWASRIARYEVMHHRDLVVQRYTPGKTLEEHATRIGTSAGSLRVALHRIRQALKRCVENTLAGETA